jgi:hypothetical protein
MTLLDAALVLDDLAAGRAPDRARLSTGALALDTLRHAGTADRDLMDAGAGLQTLATGDVLEPDMQGRDRAAQLAAAVRRLVPPSGAVIRQHKEVHRDELQSGSWDGTVFTWLGVELDIDVALKAAEVLFAAVLKGDGG